jgi:hypothetical protein
MRRITPSISTNRKRLAVFRLAFFIGGCGVGFKLLRLDDLPGKSLMAFYSKVTCQPG